MLMAALVLFSALDLACDIAPDRIEAIVIFEVLFHSKKSGFLTFLFFMAMPSPRINGLLATPSSGPTAHYIIRSGIRRQKYSSRFL
jgi:hypothetical protein